MEVEGPVRVSVLGNSCALQVCARKLEPADLPYPALLRTTLSRGGTPAHVANHSKWLGSVRDAVRDWPNAVWASWPDLVVVHHGLNEARSLLIPPFVHRVVWSLDRSDRPVADRLVGRLRDNWSRLARAAEHWDGHAVPGHMSVARFANQLNRVVSQTVVHTNAVCVLIDIHPVNEYLRLLGGAYEYRRARLQVELERVSRQNDRVGVVSLEEVQDQLGGSKAAFPDGIHLSPQAHSLVAKRITDLYRELHND